MCKYYDDTKSHQIQIAHSHKTTRSNYFEDIDFDIDELRNVSISVIRFHDQALSRDNLPASDTVTAPITDRLLTRVSRMPYRTPQKEDRAKVARSSIKRNRSDIAKWDSKRFDFDWKRTWRELDSVRLSTIFHRSVSFSWNKIESVSVGENMDGVVEILEFINRIFVTNDIAFVSSDICLMLGIEKRRNERIKRLPEMRWKSSSKTMEQKRMLNLLWNHFEGRIIKHVYRRILSIWKELYVLYITIDKRSFHSSSHLGIILWPLLFLLAIFPLERDFVSFENWDFFFQHGQGL